MKESFEVEIHPIHTSNDTTKPADPCEHYCYKARWMGRQYIADNIVCHISAVRPGDAWGIYGEYDYGPHQYEDTFKCYSRTLDGCISEAESILRDCLFGKAELLDGKYRVATVTKRYNDDYWDTNSSLTTYGEKCKKSEPKDQSEE